jgi:hypothetical protein
MRLLLGCASLIGSLSQPKSGAKTGWNVEREKP